VIVAQCSDPDRVSFVGHLAGAVGAMVVVRVAAARVVGVRVVAATVVVATVVVATVVAMAGERVGVKVVVTAGAEKV
jgi:hypothetical protein